MKYGKKEQINILKYIIISITFYWSLNNISLILSAFKYTIRISLPVLIGVLLSLILGVFVSLFERTVFKYRPKLGKLNNYRRLLSVILSVIVFFGGFILLLVIIIPQVFEAITELSSQLPSFFRKLQSQIENIRSTNPSIERWLSVSDFNLKNIETRAVLFIQNSIPNALSTTLSITSHLLGIAFQFFLGFIFSVYFLLQKERIVHFISVFLNAFTTKKTTKYIMYLLEITEDAFSNFFTGQLLDAMVVGFLTYIVTILIGINQSILIAFIMGLSALIPMFGTYIGPIASTLLLLISNPTKILIFLPAILLTVQIDINFIYPRLVGARLGTPPILILIVISIAGAIFGVYGLIFAVPFTSVFYSILIKFIDNKTNKKDSKNLSDLESNKLD